MKTRRSFLGSILGALALLIPAPLRAKVTKVETSSFGKPSDRIRMKLVLQLPDGVTSPEGHRRYAAYIETSPDLLTEENGLGPIGELLIGAVSYELARDGLAQDSLYTQHERWRNRFDEHP